MMSALLRECFVRSPAMGLPILALVIFITVFAGIVLRTLLRRPAQFEAVAALPLTRDGSEEEVHDGR